MEGLQKYPINIDSTERDIIIDLVKGQENNIPDLSQQLKDKVNPLNMSSFEQGFLMSVIGNKRGIVPGVWKQLVNLLNRFREEAGVKITDLGNNLVQLKDRDGATIIRERYEWEKGT